MKQLTKLNATHLFYMIAVRNRGPDAWCARRSRAGGAIGRMRDRLVFSSFAKGPPYELTSKGLRAIGKKK